MQKIVSSIITQLRIKITFKIFYIYIEQSIRRSVSAGKKIRFEIIFLRIVSYSRKKDELFEIIVTLL